MEYLNIVDAVKILDKDLKSRKSLTVQMKLNNIWTVFKVSNYIAKYQTNANDLILVKIKDLKTVFTVSRWDANFTICQQITNEVSLIN